MSGPAIFCPRCGTMSLQGTKYCPHCGEVLDPTIAATLQWMYPAIHDLDERIARGEGTHTLQALRDDYHATYLALRRVPATTTSAASSDASAAVAAGIGDAVRERLSAADAPAAPEAAAPPTAQPAAPAVPVAPREPQPVFTWRAFLAEQAIAIMAYMGGFLLLIATLSFEIGGWQALPLVVKLGAVCVVYAIFGILGLSFRRTQHLRTVGGAYLAVFALLTPLLALGIYRFGLQDVGFSAAGMLCLSAFYAAAIYLALAWHTRFATYAYLGWTALVVGALAAVRWAEAPGASWLFALGLAAIVLILPRLVAVSRETSFSILETPATQLGAGVAAFTAICTTCYALALGSAPIFFGTVVIGHDIVLALALAALVLVPLAVAWSFALRRIFPQPLPANSARLVGFVDWLIAAFVAQATFAVAAAFRLDHAGFALVAAGLALGEGGAVLALRRVAGARERLRSGVSWLAIAVAVLGALLVIAAPSPNWPLIIVLGAGMLVALAFAGFERQPYWLIAAGIFLIFAYHALLLALLPAKLTHPATNALPDSWLSLSSYHTLLTVALWLVAFAVGRRRGGGRVSGSIYLVALLDALYISTLQIGADHIYATLILALLAALSLLAALREEEPLAGAALVAFFGLLATLPLTANTTETNGVAVALVAVVPALLALGIRWLRGRMWSLGLYVVAFWAVCAATWHLAQVPDMTTRDWALLGVPFAALVPLAVAVLASVVAVWEDAPQITIIPAALLYVGIALTPGGIQSAALVLVGIAVGVGLRALRGRGWNSAWLVAALLGSLFAVFRLGDQGTAAPHWQVGFLLLLAVVAYFVAVQEGRAWLTTFTGLYAFFAVALLPSHSAGPVSDNFVPTLLAFVAVAIFSVLAERRLGWQWALSLYILQLFISMFALARINLSNFGGVEALMLIFAAVVYGQAVVGRQPALLWGTLFYALLATLIQPDAHALLPLAIALAVLGLFVGRVGGWRWSSALYLAALLAAAATALRGTQSPGFEALALLSLTLLAYLIAVLESRPDVIPLALLLGALALAATLGWADAHDWLVILSFAALGWLYTLTGRVWSAIPWLHPTPNGDWWIAGTTDAALREQSGDPRTAGVWVHRAGGAIVALGTVLVAPLIRAATVPQSSATQAEALALLSLAALLAFLSRVETLYPLRYVAGSLVAIAISWELRWLGADNLQAFIIAPGSYLVLIGALLPADARLRHPARLGQYASLAGALVLLLPTVVQSFTDPQSWIYALVLAGEAITLTAVGVGTRSRLLILVGTSFVGIAALRGAVIAFDSGVPVALIIAAFALLLLGAATWLSLGARRDATTPPSSPTAPAPGEAQP